METSTFFSPFISSLSVSRLFIFFSLSIFSLSFSFYLLFVVFFSLSLLLFFPFLVHFSLSLLSVVSSSLSRPLFPFSHSCLSFSISSISPFLLSSLSPFLFFIFCSLSMLSFLVYFSLSQLFPLFLGSFEKEKKNGNSIPENLS